MKTVIGKYDKDTKYYSFACPSCGQHYKGNSRYLGTVIHCKKCDYDFLLNAEKQESAPSPSIQKNSDIDFSNEIIEGNITCPHCWNTFSAEHVLRISAHPDLLGDPVLGAMEQKRFIPTIFNAEGIPLDEMNMPSPDMACPHCRLNIPESIVDDEASYISIVGAPSSGKSYYLTALIHALRKTLPERAEYSFSDVDPRINKTLNEYEDLMFMAVDKTKVVTLLKTEQVGRDYSDQTVLNGLPVNLPKPFIFQQVPLSIDSINTERNAPKNIVFYDNAGEHFQPGQERVSNPATLHLVHSDAIFFIFDPLNDADMRGICDPNDPQIKDSSKMNNQTVLFSEMISRIKRHGKHVGSGYNERSPIPLVIIVGKYDTWESKFNFDIRNMSLFQTNRETFDTEFDEEMLYTISYAVRELLNQYAPGIISQAESFFSNVLFLPVSSFGSLAEVANKEKTDHQRAVGVLPSKLSPIWVDIPYYAILNHFAQLRKKAPDTSDAIPLAGNINNGKLQFIHPLLQRKEQLPLNYAGHCIRINNQKYLLPGRSNMATSASQQKKDFWH